MRFIRRLFGLRPKVGDPVSGGLDFSVSYEGVVVEICNNKYMPGAYVSGTITINSDWKGVLKEEHLRFSCRLIGFALRNLSSPGQPIHLPPSFWAALNNNAQ